MTTRTWKLLGPDGAYDSPSPGTLGGHRRSRIYGRLDCASAARAIGRGGYTGARVFFASVDDAVACGYRPCATCLPEDYDAWKRRTRPADRVLDGRPADGAGPGRSDVVLVDPIDVDRQDHAP